MDLATIIPWIVLAVGGAIGGNVFGAITRGGGGLVGRTILGALGGAATGYAAQSFPSLGAIAGNWGELVPNDAALSAHLANLITGGAGGSIVGLVTGLLIRPR